MGKVLNFLSFDKLTNIMSGKGTTADRSVFNRYAFVPLDYAQAEASYRSSWLVRKIVDVPALDMTRAWRDWQAESADIEKLEAEEKRLQLKEKCKRALILSRLFGGGALLLGTNDHDPSQPLNVASAKAGGLTYVHVLSRHQMTIGEQRLDPTDPWFGKPEYFQINTAGPKQQQVKIHPSRIIEFIGQRVPEGSYYGAGALTGAWFWGDPIMQSIGEAVQNADMAQGGFAALIDEAKVDILKIPDLTARAATPQYEEQLLKRLQAASAGKSTWRMLAIDGQEEWDQRQITWAGMPQVMDSFLLIVAGAADIPMTRLLGQSPKGLQSTGDSEERDYQSMIKARQEELLAPALDRIDEMLVPSALGSKPSDIYYLFAPLQEENEKDGATIESQIATTIKTYADTGLIPDVALSEIAKNRIVESGRWPGSEKAFEDAANEPLPNEANPDQLTTIEQRVAKMEQAGTVTQADAIHLITDAAPRSLYVQRKLLNAQAVIDWAKGQGFTSTLAADDMHVTVLYSRQPVDWMAMGQSWDQDDQGRIRVAPGGPRMLDQFGSVKPATVLLFSSSSLCWRHEEMIRNGASHDFEDYVPHITLTYDAPADLDLSTVEPYRGELVFGPEFFQALDEDWKQSVTEE
jgi:phage-related protein (TIGR01555 family)